MADSDSHDSVKQSTTIKMDVEILPLLIYTYACMHTKYVIVQLQPNSPQVASLTISAPQLTFDVPNSAHLYLICILQIFLKKYLDFSCIQLWIVFVLKMCVETQYCLILFETIYISSVHICNVVASHKQQ